MMSFSIITLLYVEYHIPQVIILIQEEHVGSLATPQNWTSGVTVKSNVVKSINTKYILSCLVVFYYHYHMPNIQ